MQLVIIELGNVVHVKTVFSNLNVNVKYYLENMWWIYTTDTEHKNLMWKDRFLFIIIFLVRKQCIITLNLANQQQHRHIM